jgi:hypothetical protein
MKLLMFILLVGLAGSAAAELPTGHPTVKDALAASGSSPDERKTALPNEGTVVSTIHSSGYTYIEVKQGENNIWLAAPKVDLLDGALIRYGKGISMVNFYSNGLKREFPEVFFINRVEMSAK